MWLFIVKQAKLMSLNAFCDDISHILYSVISLFHDCLGVSRQQAFLLWFYIGDFIHGFSGSLEIYFGKVWKEQNLKICKLNDWFTSVYNFEWLSCQDAAKIVSNCLGIDIRKMCRNLKKILKNKVIAPRDIHV